MITRNSGSQPRKIETVSIKMVGIGGAGSNLLDRMALDGLEQVRLVSMNTDSQSLLSSVAGEKIQLGRNTTHGLGAGGDPDLGVAAAEEAADEIRRAFENVSMAFVCAGLGGGTGSGAAPRVAALAREQGALVVAFVTLPFTFEGQRRRQQADDALAALRDSADVVICFENDKMGDAAASKTGIQHAFAATDLILGQSVKAISTLFTRPGLIRIGFDDLAAALRNRHARCIFGYGESESDNRIHDALAHALKSPLMDRGRILSEAHKVLVNIAGGPGLTLNEVQIMMDELGKFIHERTQILFGTVVDPSFGNKVSITILSSTGDAQPLEEVRPAPVAARSPVSALAPARVARPEPAESLLEPELLPTAPETEEPIDAPLLAEEISEPVSDEAAAEPAVESAAESDSQPESRPEPPRRSREFAFPVPSTPILRSTASPAKKATAEARQETLQFEPVTRGRFEKSEPTIVDGQDLDIPTFLRLNVKLNK